MSIESYESEIRMIPGVYVPVRCTVVRDGDQAVMIAPINFTSQQLAYIKSKGPITDIIAPGLFHHLFIKKALQEFPEAELWGVRGFSKKRPDLPWKHTVCREEWKFGKFLDVQEVRGMGNAHSESVFFHNASQTLIAGDLVFNLTNPQGWLAPVMFRIFGTYKRFNVSLLMFFVIKDKKKFISSMNEILRWNFESIFMAHGDIVEVGGKEMLTRALKGRGLL